MTTAEAGQRLRVSPQTVEGWIAAGHLECRRAGTISEAALTTFIERQQRITRRYLQLVQGGLARRPAWAEAQRREPHEVFPRKHQGG